MTKGSIIEERSIKLQPWYSFILYLPWVDLARMKRRQFSPTVNTSRVEANLTPKLVCLFTAKDTAFKFS
jgi:hypothetical protein